MSSVVTSPLDGTDSPLTANKVSIPILSSIDYNVSYNNNNSNSNSQPAVDSPSLHATNQRNKMEVSTATLDMGCIEMADCIAKGGGCYALGRQRREDHRAWLWGCQGVGVSSRGPPSVVLYGSSLAGAGSIVCYDQKKKLCHEAFEHQNSQETELRQELA